MGGKVDFEVDFEVDFDYRKKFEIFSVNRNLL